MIFSFLLAITTSSLFATPQPLDHLAETSSSLKGCDSNTLIVLDVDDVILTTEDHFAHPYALDTTYEIIETLKAEKTEEEIDHLTSLCYLLPKRVLVEEKTPSLIAQWQKKGIKVIALTSCTTGKLGAIDRVEDWRLNDLHHFGIDLESSFPQVKRLALTEMTSPKHPSPLFVKGVLFSEGYNKGEVLKVFLKQVKFSPSKVIFIDDLPHNLTNVGKVLQEENIPHLLLQYTGAKRHAKPLDASLIKRQLTHLMTHKEWLPDKTLQVEIKGNGSPPANKVR